jgi:hypothetical protein
MLVEELDELREISERARQAIDLVGMMTSTRP